MYCQKSVGGNLLGTFVDLGICTCMQFEENLKDLRELSYTLPVCSSSQATLHFVESELSV